MGRIEYQADKLYNRHILLSHILVRYTTWREEDLVVKDLFKFEKPMMTLRVVQVLAAVRSAIEDYEKGCTNPELVKLLHLKSAEMSSKEINLLIEKLESKLNLDKFTGSPLDLLTASHPDPQHTSILSYAGHLAKNMKTINLKRILKLACKEIDPYFGEDLEKIILDMGLVKLDEVKWRESVNLQEWIVDTAWIPYLVKKNYNELLSGQTVKVEPRPGIKDKRDRSVSTSLELHASGSLTEYQEDSSEKEKKIFPREIKEEKSKHSLSSMVRPPSPGRKLSPARLHDYRTGANLEPIRGRSPLRTGRSPHRNRSPMRPPAPPAGDRRPRARSESVYERPPKRRNLQRGPPHAEKKGPPYRSQVLRIERVDFDKYEENQKRKPSPRKEGYIVRDKYGNNACGEHVFEERPHDLMQRLVKFMISRDAFVHVREGFVSQRFELTESISDVVQFHLADQNEDILSSVQRYLAQFKEDLQGYLNPLWENFTHLENRMREMQAALAAKEVVDAKRHQELMEFNGKMRGWISVSQDLAMETRKIARDIDGTTLELLEAEKTGFTGDLNHHVALGKRVRGERLAKEGYSTGCSSYQSDYAPMTSEEGSAIEEYIPSEKKMEIAEGEEKKMEIAGGEKKKMEIAGGEKKKVPTKGEKKEVEPAGGGKKKKRSARGKQEAEPVTNILEKVNGENMEQLMYSVENLLDPPKDKLTALVEETTKIMM